MIDAKKPRGGLLVVEIESAFTYRDLVGLLDTLSQRGGCNAMAAQTEGTEVR